MSNILLSGPPEVTARILQSVDDFNDLFAFITSCKRVYTVWSANPGAIIWAVGRRSIVAFEDALMAVRATNIIIKASQSGSRPPDPFPVHDLTGSARKPDPFELNSIFNMKHLMDCMEWMMLNTPMRPFDLFRANPSDPCDQVYEDLDAWRRNLHRALYRVILVGAVCSRAYNEPLLVALEEGDAVMVDALNEKAKSMDGIRVNNMARQTREFLQKFPVYNYDAADDSERGLWRDREYESIFGPLASWLVADGRTRCVREGLKREGDDDDDSTIREILHLLAAYEHFRRRIANTDGSDGFGRPKPIAQSADDMPFTEAIRGAKIRTQKAIIVLFGIFHVEEVALPVHMEDLDRRILSASPHNMAQAANSEEVLAGVARRRTNLLDVESLFPWPERFETPGMLQFFQFLVRKHFKLKFSIFAYDEDGEDFYYESPYESLAETQLFCDGQWSNGTLIPYSRRESSTDRTYHSDGDINDS